MHQAHDALWFCTKPRRTLLMRLSVLAVRGTSSSSRLDVRVKRSRQHDSKLLPVSSSRLPGSLGTGKTNLFGRLAAWACSQACS